MTATVLGGDQSTTAARLVDATLRSIHEHGLHGTTVTTVSDLAGLSRGMVRHEFGSKQAMLVHAMRTLCEQWVAATEPDPSLHGVERVRCIVEAMFSAEVFTPAAIDGWMALSVASGSDAELRAVREVAQERWRSQLASALAECEVSDPDVAATGLLAAADGLWLQQRLDGSTRSRDHAIAAIGSIVDALCV